MKNLISEYGMISISIISIIFFFFIISLMIGKNNGLSLVYTYNTNMLYDNELVDLDKGMDNFDVGQGALDRTNFYNQPHFYENDEVGYKLPCPSSFTDNNPEVQYSASEVYDLFANSGRITFNSYQGGTWQNDTPLTSSNGAVLVITKYTPISIDAAVGGGSVQNKVLVAPEPLLDKFGNEVVDENGVVQTTDKIQYTVTRYAISSDGSQFVEVDEDGNEIKGADGSPKSTFYINWDTACRYQVLYRYLDVQLKSEYTAMFTNDVRDKTLVYEQVFENWLEHKDDPEEVVLALASLEIGEGEVIDVEVFEGDDSAYTGTTWFGMEDDSDSSEGSDGEESDEVVDEVIGDVEEEEEEGSGDSEGDDESGSEDSEGDDNSDSEGDDNSESEGGDDSKPEGSDESSGSDSSSSSNLENNGSSNSEVM